MKKFKVLACKVLMRELYLLAAHSQHIIDIKWLEQQLHNTPEKLRAQLQKEIHEVEDENETYDAILLGYGLCSNGIQGLRSHKTPLIVPRGHDCMTLLLGSKERYQKLFDQYSGGIYWYSPGWIEHCSQPGRERYEKTYQEYLDKYGEDNAQYLMEMEQNWMQEYHCAMYVGWPEIPSQQYRQYTKECADYLQWEFHQEEGSSSLMHEMLEGNWNRNQFLIVQPGMEIIPTNDDTIIGVRPYGQEENR